MRYSASTLLSVFSVATLSLLPLAACSSSSGDNTSDEHDSGGGGTVKDAAADHTSSKPDAGHDSGHPADAKKDTEQADAAGDASSSDAQPVGEGGSADAAPDVAPHDAGTDAENPDAAHDAEATTDATTDGSATPHDAATDAPTDAHDAATDAHDAAVTAPTVQNYFMGRWDTTGVSMANTATGVGSVAHWPGSGVITTFTGPNVGVTLSETCNASKQCDSVTVELDGVPQNVVVLNSTSITNPATGPSPYAFTLISGTNTIQISGITGTAAHTIGIFKNTDSFYGGSYSFGGFTPAAQGTNPKATYTFAHHIEWIGDDITCARGAITANATAAQCNNADDPSLGPPNTASSEYDSYARIVSKAVGAERYNLSISNDGLVDGNGSAAVLFPSVYGFTNPDGTGGAWTFSKWTPDLVVVNLGSYGDFAGTTSSFDESPLTTADKAFVSSFETAYEALLATIRMNYPTTPILAVAGNGYAGSIDYEVGKTFAQAAVTARLAAGETNKTLAYVDGGLFANFTCNYYPDTTGQTALATAVQSAIMTLTGW